MIKDILLISCSIINIFIIALLIIKRKTNIALGLSIIQAFAWIFRFLGYY
jgi:hypothetical protein